MFYQILRFPVLILFFVFYRRIYFAGKHHIPKDAPTLVASNHATAFMEQILIAVLQFRSVYFWVKGAIFDSNPKLLPIFKQVHLIPIWKPESGVKKMQNNVEIFEKSKGILLTGKMFYIAPEGISWSEKRLLPFKTGTARLALSAAAETNFEKDIFILPTGVNYTYPRLFRSEVLISFGPPINVKNYKAIYEENPSFAAKKLTEDLKEAISKEVVMIDNKEDDELVEQLHILLRNEYQHYNDKIFSENNARLRLEQEVANTCNQLNETAKNELKQAAKNYFEKLEKYQFQDKAIEQKGAFNWWIFLKFLMLFPFAFLGGIGGFLPVSIAKYLRNKMIKNKQFWAPMAVVFSLITWVVYSVFIIIITTFVLGWMAFLMPLILVVLQYIAFVNKENWRDILNNYRYNQWKQKQLMDNDLLEKERSELVNKYFGVFFKKSNRFL